MLLKGLHSNMFTCLFVMFAQLIVLCYRYLSYNTRIQLVVLDYNAHLDHEKVNNKCGDVICNQKFQERTKKWGPTPSLVNKKYDYIPDLLEEIEPWHIQSRNNLKKGQPSPYDHPASIARTIGNSQLGSTKEMVQKTIKMSMSTFSYTVHVYRSHSANSSPLGNIITL